MLKLVIALLISLNLWLPAPIQATGNYPTDLDLDGDVDFLDYHLLLAQTVNSLDLNYFNHLYQTYGQSLNPTSAVGVYFTVQVADESFCLYTTDPATIELGYDNYYGLKDVHPHGQVIGGSSGFNYGCGGDPGDKYWRYWSWHLDPATTRLVDLSIELCDALPSGVERGDLGSSLYCPWLAKITALGCPSSPPAVACPLELQ
ncbi:hypothetical protein A2W24_03530 [Microgenomates group bacterium RBG_16_45_19]|nr:MAG: hypothetical protein A2W24_03530 [Microgenomates group bacterium RBG_16_45_19]